MRADMKQWVILLTVLAVLSAPSFLLPLRLNRDIPSDDLSSLEQHFARDAELRTRLAQAMEQERDGALDDARAGYLAAALSTNPSLRDAATKGLARVSIKKDDPIWQFAFYGQEFAMGVRHLVTIVALALLVGWIFLSLIRLLPRRSGFSIGDFAVKDMLNEPGQAAALGLEFRQAIADSLSVIQLVHSNFAAELALLSEPVIVPSFGLPGTDRDELASALAGIVELQAGPVRGFSLEKLLNVANVFHERRRYVIAKLSTAIDLYKAMEMTFWLPQAEAALAQVEGR
jgi:hypothetical protein